LVLIVLSFKRFFGNDHVMVKYLYGAFYPEYYFYRERRKEKNGGGLGSIGFQTMFFSTFSVSSPKQKKTSDKTTISRVSFLDGMDMDGWNQKMSLSLSLSLSLFLMPNMWFVADL
jgi:hypothetical protein